MGVATCAGPCHGRQSALGVAEGPAMRGSEIVVWQDLNTLRGKHSQAFKALQGARARDIARKLGIGEPADAQECLSCHSDDPARRGPQLLRSDGVSCEACHGGAGGKWLASHYAPGRHPRPERRQRHVSDDDPVARSRLCESCHLGASASDQYVTHRIMGAGHPGLPSSLNCSPRCRPTTTRTRTTPAGSKSPAAPSLGHRPGDRLSQRPAALSRQSPLPRRRVPGGDLLRLPLLSPADLRQRRFPLPLARQSGAAERAGRARLQRCQPDRAGGGQPRRLAGPRQRA